MSRWKYLIVEMQTGIAASDVSKLFDDYGADGWELVAVRPVITSVGSKWDWLAIFKRPSSDTAPEGQP